MNEKENHLNKIKNPLLIDFLNELFKDKKVNSEVRDLFPIL